jgi:ComF family protein
MAAVALAEGLADADVVVPVPLGPGRHRRRGYNQACLLASSVARHLGLAFAPRGLRRVRDPGPQDRRGRADRLARVRGCFAPGRPSSVQGRRVLLVDDVVTTGATAGECARVLLAAGAASVDVLSLARAGCDAG